MKKGMMLVLAAVMLVSCLTGCGKENDSDYEFDYEQFYEEDTKEKEPLLDLSEYPVTPAEYFTYEEMLTSSLEDRFGMKLNTTAERCIVINEYKNDKNDIEVVVVPPEIDGKPVVAIMDAVTSRLRFVNGLDNNEVRAIVFPDSVEIISGSIGYRTDNLEKVQFGNGLKRVGCGDIEDYLFSDCRIMKELVFPDSLEVVDTIIVFYSGVNRVMERIHFPESAMGKDARIYDEGDSNADDSKIVIECAPDSYFALYCDEEYLMSQDYEGTRDLENYKENRKSLSRFYEKYTNVFAPAHSRYRYANEELGIVSLMFNEKHGETVIGTQENGYQEATIDGVPIFVQDIPEEITKQYNATTYEGVEKMALDVVNHAIEEQQAGAIVLDYVTIDSHHGPMTVVATGLKEEITETKDGKEFGKHFIMWKIYGDKIIGVRGADILARTVAPMN